jgi:hypothetical protein
MPKYHLISLEQYQEFGEPNAPDHFNVALVFPVEVCPSVFM